MTPALAILGNLSLVSSKILGKMCQEKEITREWASIARQERQEDHWLGRKRMERVPLMARWKRKGEGEQE